MGITTIQLKKDGPIIVHGAISIIYGDEDGEAGRPNDPEQAIALCRCGCSNNKPFCDGSHGECERGLPWGELE